MGELAGRLTDLALRHARLVVAIVVGVAAGSALLALRLDGEAGAGTLTDTDSAAAEATDKLHSEFGDEPITVLVTGRAADGRLPGLLLTEDVDRIRGLEGCLSGNLPPGAQPPAPACAALARRKPIQVVHGPGTFINESARQIASRFDAQRSRQASRAERAARKVAAAQGLPKAEQDRLALQARRLANAQFKRNELRLGLQYGFTGPPAINNPYFVLRLVFEPSLGYDVPKARFAYLFPSRNSALIQARPRAGLSRGERRQTINLVRSAVASAAFQLQHGDYVVSGEPVIEEEIASSIPGELAGLALTVLALMGGVLVLLFRSVRWLVPLLVGLVAGAFTFGAVSLFGGSLTIAKVAALPLIVGIGAGFSLQFQARYDEARKGGGVAAAAAAAVRAPGIVLALLVTTVSLLTIRVSPVPMVRSFGTTVAVGVVLAFFVMLTAGVALLSGDIRLPRARFLRRVARVGSGAAERVGLAARRAGPVARRVARAVRQTPRPAPPARVVSLARRLPNPTGALRRLGLAAISATSRAPAFAKGAWSGWLGTVARRPRRVLALGLVAAVAGWALDSRTELVSGLERLGPGDARGLEQAKTVDKETDAVGDVTVVVRGKDVTSPRVVAWMVDYQKQVLRRHGYRERRSCRSAELCPSLSLTNLFGSAPLESPAQIRALLDSLPRNFSQSVVSRDRRTATIAFGVRAMPLERQRDLIDDMRARLDEPAGVHAELAGAPVLASEQTDLQSNRRLLALTSLALVLALLVWAFGDRRSAFASLIPSALATGWSALIVLTLGFSLDALSATLPALVVAITASLCLILSVRYRTERAGGLASTAALERTYRLSRPAGLGFTAIVVTGFAALITSDVPMLRDFGVVSVVDLIVVLAATALMLPAALIWAEQRAPLPRSRAEATAMVRAAGARARARSAALSRRLRRLPVPPGSP